MRLSIHVCVWVSFPSEIFNFTLQMAVPLAQYGRIPLRLCKRANQLVDALHRNEQSELSWLAGCGLVRQGTESSGVCKSVPGTSTGGADTIGQYRMKPCSLTRPSSSRRRLDVPGPVAMTTVTCLTTLSPFLYPLTDWSEKCVSDCSLED